MRQEAVSQIYGQVDGKEPPAHNIVSEALRAYYTRVDRQTLNTWACQVLCMIVEYHMACMTRGSPVTSPLVPGELKERDGSGSLVSTMSTFLSCNKGMVPVIHYTN